MTEQTDAPAGGAEAEATTPAVETTSEATTEQTTGAEEAGPADDAGEATEEPKEKKVPWFQKRIDEVTAQKYEAQRQADYWRGLAEGRTPQTQTAPQTVGPPQLEQFETYDDFEEAKIAYIVEQRLSQAKQQEQRQAEARTYEERQTAFRASRPDFDVVALNPNLKVSETMARAVWESDQGPEVLYHLGSNPQEAARISALSPTRQAVEIGRIEAALTKAPLPSVKPIPPAPPQTVAGVSAGLKKSHEEMSYAEYKAARDAEEKARN